MDRTAAHPFPSPGAQRETNSPRPAPQPPSILIIDDEVYILQALRAALRRTAFSVRTASSPRQALAMLAEAPADVVISDFKMPEMNGVEFLRQVKELYPKTQRIMLTGYADQSCVQDAINECEVYRFITKPWDEAALISTLMSAAEQHHLVMENERLHELAVQRARELEELNHSLEERVRVRTHLLAQAKREWELTFDAITDPLAIIGKDRSVIRANLAYAQAGLRDVKALRGMKCHEALFGRADVCPECPLDRSRASGEGAIALLQSGITTYRVVAYPLNVDDAVCSYRDVSAERQMERQMVQSEKMAAVGQLAAGVAHEINNPLAAILAFAQIMRAEAGRSAQDLEALSMIESSGLRAKKIVEALLRFVRRPDTSAPEDVDLGKLCEEAVALMRPTTKARSIAIEVDVPAQPVWVEGIGNHLSQVLINLVQNAMQAVSEEGRIRVAVRPEEGKVLVSVSDNGPGIAPEIIDRIWEPFFTTKPEGVGTGLGLSIVHRIVEEHHGRVTVESVPGHGATFTITLPRKARGPAS